MCKRLSKSAGGVHRIACAKHFGNDDGEFIAAEACHEVAGTDHFVDACCYLVEKLISGVVAERLVDNLETIEVEGQQSDHHLLFSSAHERSAQAIDEQRPVGKPGELIMVGAALELFGRLYGCRDVGCVDDDSADGWVVGEVFSGDIERWKRPICVGDS